MAVASAAMAQEGHWIDVPFVAQPPEGCGAAAISMLMRYWNSHGATAPAEVFDTSAIQQKLHSPSDHGIKASDMVRYFSEHGFRTFAIKGSRNDIEQQIAKGRPLIAALAPLKNDRILHYVVVAGFVPEENVVLVNDPAQRKLLKSPWNEFEKQWSAADYWTLVVVPKS